MLVSSKSFLEWGPFLMFMGLVGYSIYSTVRGARGGGKVSALATLPCDYHVNTWLGYLFNRQVQCSIVAERRKSRRQLQGRRWLQ